MLNKTPFDSNAYKKSRNDSQKKNSPALSSSGIPAVVLCCISGVTEYKAVVKIAIELFWNSVLLKNILLIKKKKTTILAPKKITGKIIAAYSNEVLEKTDKNL